METMRLAAYVQCNEALKLAEKFISKKKIDGRITGMESVLFPHYLVKNIIEIRRGFKLKPKRIEHVYMIDARNGSSLRLKEVPDIEAFDEMPSLKPILSCKECISAANEIDFKHATRYYKSFWAPEIINESYGIVYLPVWSVIMDGSTKNLQVNSYSGKVSKARA